MKFKFRKASMTDNYSHGNLNEISSDPSEKILDAMGYFPKLLNSLIKR